MPSLLSPYNPTWPTAFQQIRQALEQALDGLGQPIDIQHVGSTSIQGMHAKPIIDIDIIIENKILLPEIKKRLETLGYQYKGDQGIAGRFAFRQSTGSVPFGGTNSQPQAHHLYVCYADSLAVKNHLLFRDTLRSDKGLVEEYAALKMSLTDDHTITRETYTLRKTNFILSVLAKAGLSEKELEEIAQANG
jgi:GrpB-like predicted nucleotidyltransferase (UPF0157 family)